MEAEAEVRFSNETRDDENDSPESTLEATVLLEVEAEVETTTKTRGDKNYNPRSVLNTKYIPQWKKGQTLPNFPPVYNPVQSSHPLSLSKDSHPAEYFDSCFK